MKIIESFLTGNDCYLSGRKIKPQGLMLHSVGCSQPSAQVFVNSWNRPGVGACVHAFIDANDGTVYQTLPWDHRAWHCAGSGNDTHISVEMCEPACIDYTSGSGFTCSNDQLARQNVVTCYISAVELFAELCQKFNLDPLTQICSHKEGYDMGIASDHGDPEHLWKGLGMPYTMDGFRRDVKACIEGKEADMEEVEGTARMLTDMPIEEVIKTLGAIALWDNRKTGVLGSLTVAQAILESGYGKSELAQNANNFFGMKENLSGNTWEGSTWKGDVYTKMTNEETLDGEIITIEANFRKYPTIADSFADHSAYLVGAKVGGINRYEGIQGCTDFKRSAEILMEGGYATASNYVAQLVSLYERYDLKRYEYVPEPVEPTAPVDSAPKKPTVKDLKAAVPFLVCVDTPDLTVKSNAGKGYKSKGVTGIGIFTITKVRKGTGSKLGWGKLKSGAGYIPLSKVKILID